MSRTRIKELSFFTAESPLSQPIADATHQIPAIHFIVARVTTEGGVVGEGYLLAFHFNSSAIRGALADGAGLCILAARDRTEAC